MRVETNPIYDPDSLGDVRHPKITAFPPPHIYAVTNKHVARGGFPVIRLNTIDNRLDVLELDHHEWIPHPEGDDLAVAPVELAEGKHSFFSIDTRMFVDRDFFG